MIPSSADLPPSASANALRTDTYLAHACYYLCTFHYLAGATKMLTTTSSLTAVLAIAPFIRVYPGLFMQTIAANPSG